MSRTLLQRFLGFIVGLIAAGALVVGVEFFSEAVYPLPKEVHELKGEAFYEAVCQHVAGYPHWILGVVVLLWGAAISIGVGLASFIGGRVPGVILGILLFLMLLMNVWGMGLPYPLWFKVVEVVTFPLFFLAGLYFQRTKRPEALAQAA